MFSVEVSTTVASRACCRTPYYDDTYPAYLQSDVDGISPAEFAASVGRINASKASLWHSWAVAGCLVLLAGVVLVVVASLVSADSSGLRLAGWIAVAVGSIGAAITAILRGDEGLIPCALLRRACDLENARYYAHRSPPVAFRVRTAREFKRMSREVVSYKAHLVLECGASTQDGCAQREERAAAAGWQEGNEDKASWPL